MQPGSLPGYQQDQTRQIQATTALDKTLASDILLFHKPPHEAKQIGPLIQQIRSEHGVKSIGLGRAGLQQGPAWEMRREMMSPRYTTHWRELLTVKVA